MAPNLKGLQPDHWKKWLPLGILAVVAVLAGVVLPQALPATLPERPAVETNSPIQSWSYQQPAWPEPPNHQAMFMRLGLGTLIVLALCVGTIFACKRWLKTIPAGTTATGQMRLVETLALSNRCWVHLIHVGKQSVLVSGDGSGVKTVTPLPDNFEQALLEQEAAGLIRDEGRTAGSKRLDLGREGVEP